MIIESGKNQRQAIKLLLSAEGLPVDDLPATLNNFVVATENGQVIAVAGIEIYGNYGLLRSLAVASAYRNKGVASKLVERIESMAGAKGLNDLYLLTETAPEYFAGKGFQKIAREAVPEAVKQSSEFSHVCPASAVVMKKSISS